MNAPVIIVGGGPVGLSLALGLARYGVASTIIERDAVTHRESRAIVIWPRTIEILRDWGVYEHLRDAARFERLFTVRNAKTEKLEISADFVTLDDVFDDPGFLIIPQYETERVLRELVDRTPETTLVAPATVTSLRQDSHFAEVRYTEASGAERVVHGSYVAGCDGARGVIRSALGLTLEGITYDSRVVLSDERMRDANAPGSLARARFDLPGLCGAIHIGGDLWRVLATVSKDQSDEEALSDAAHRSRVANVLGEAATETVWRSIFRIHRRHAQRFLIGRTVIAGDAAHLNSPAGGQGMNAGIQDAANLAWKLAAALGGAGDGAALLNSYDVERHEMVTDSVERYTNRLTRVAIGFSTRARSFVIRTIGRAIRARGMQRKLCRSLGMLTGRYTRSPIVDARHPLAGRRIDDLRLPGGRRINAARAGDAAVITVGDVAIAGALLNVAEPPKRWHIKRPCALIVRPDGCVAAVVEKPTQRAVEAAWSRAFCGTMPYASTRSSIETL